MGDNIVTEIVVPDFGTSTNVCIIINDRLFNKLLLFFNKAQGHFVSLQINFVRFLERFYLFFVLVFFLFVLVYHLVLFIGIGDRCGSIGLWFVACFFDELHI